MHIYEENQLFNIKIEKNDIIGKKFISLHTYLVLKKKRNL